ncbi:MAG: fibronectin type III domain-containing protein [Desulfuromonadales bacterium]|nr:fibronectin type III domain-containing protein [Desulfuromonadales bacterium]
MVGGTLVNAGSLTLAGIANGVKVEVEGVFANGVLIASKIQIENAVPPTTVPTAPVASAVGGFNQATISWDGVSGATSYNIYWSTTTGVTPATGTKIANVTSPFVQTGLTAATTYFYVVTAVNSVGESAPSTQVSATTTSAPTVPATPIGVSAVGGANQATISWAAVTGATSYNIYWSTTAGVTPATGTKITNVASPFVQTGLTAATTYFYVVTAANAVGESAPSAQVSATTASAAVPPAPTGVTAVGGAAQATISWTAVTGATSYNIYWSTTTGVTPLTGTLIANATSPFIQTGLIASTTYFYVVTAVNAAGESASSIQASATTNATPVPPAAPTGVTAVGGTNQVTISWPAVAGATSYNLYWSTTTGVTPATGTLIANVTSPFIHTGLAASTTYFYVLTALNAVGASAPSAQVSATTLAPVLNGAALYAANCAGCHGALAVSEKRGRTAAQTQAAINNNAGGMGFLSILTPAQVQAIATALNF